MILKKDDCTITTFEHKERARGHGVKVYHNPTSQSYIYYGGKQALLPASDEYPSYYHPSMFSKSESKRFISQLGDYL